MKKVGIICDNYKVKKFKSELDKANLVYTEMPFSKGQTLIKILCNSSQVEQIRKICVLCEIELKQSN